MNFQPISKPLILSKPSKRWTVALMIAATAITSTTVYYGFSQVGHQSKGLQVTQQEVTSGEPGENLDRRIVEVRIRLNPEDSKRVADLTNMQVQTAIQL